MDHGRLPANLITRSRDARVAAVLLNDTAIRLNHEASSLVARSARWRSARATRAHGSGQVIRAGGHVTRRTRGRFEQRFFRSAIAPKLARDAVLNWLGDGAPRALVEDAMLAVSELVTNAVQHGEGVLTLRLLLGADLVHVDVIDEGGSFAYQPSHAGFSGARGRGLPVVAALASDWGIDEGSTHVWFELKQPPGGP